MSARPDCTCHGEPMTRRNDRRSGYRCTVRHAKARGRWLARMSAEGRCTRCGKLPGPRGLRDSGVCRPCHGRKLLAAEQRNRAARLADGAETFRTALEALGTFGADAALDLLGVAT